MPSASQEPWHARTVSDVLDRFGSSADGLTTAEAARRLDAIGPNAVTPPRPESVGAILLRQVRSVIVVLLLAAIGVSLLSGDVVEALAIAVVLAINTILGFTMELRARRAIEALRDLDVPHAGVWRAGRLSTVDARRLVPGDVVQLDAGRHVPADGRLLEVEDLRVDEAPLTGESLPVSKHPDAVEVDTALADRRSMAYKGTTVLAGRARLVVTATGAATELGRIGQLVGGVHAGPTSFERQLDRLGRRLVWATLGIAALVAGLGWLHGQDIGLVLETSIALAVAAVPEALPVVATMALAVGVHRMARRHALVRSLPAVEGLGSTTVVCTDKTRTLTSGEMAVVRVWTCGRTLELPGPGDGVADEAVRALLEAGARASHLQADGGAQADPVDRAVIAAARAAGLSPDPGRPVVASVPFTSERKRLVVFAAAGDRFTAWVKGAPVAVIGACSHLADDAGAAPLDEARQREVAAINDRFAADGLRVLAVAAGDTDGADEAAVRGLVLLGFLGLADPPAAGVPATVARLKRAGLRTVMVTGDQRLTAEAIGRAVGVLGADDHAIDGRELDRLTPDRREAAMAGGGAFTRVTPEHKLEIVRTLQARGETVAMLGDGINDAAALRQADIGVAMGRRGSDVAKQAAAIVLQDDRFETIATAVEEGRVIFDNIRRFVFYLFSCNVAEILVLLVAGIAGLPLPLLPLQLLWLNLATDTFPALALAVEPPAGDVMARAPRRPGTAILSAAFMRRVGGYAALITAATLGAFLWALPSGELRATTVAFATLALAQVGHLGNARRSESLLVTRHAFSNPFAILGALMAVVLLVAAIQLPSLARVLHTTPLTLHAWLVVCGWAALPALAGEGLKLVAGLREASGPHSPAGPSAA